MTTELKWGAASDVGLVRSENQDRFFVNPTLFIVADGMGGHAGGELAAQLAVDHVSASFKLNPSRTGLEQAVRDAHAAIKTRSFIDESVSNMGTTITGIALVNQDYQDQFVVINVGDSRTYVLRLGELEQLSEDDSVVGELLRKGIIDQSEAELHEQRHMLTQALGIGDELEINSFLVDPVVGERFLICSDGLTREVSHTQIASVLRRIADPKEAVRELVTMAVARGGSDNVTAIVVDVVSSSFQDSNRQTSKQQSSYNNEPTPILKTYGLDPANDLGAQDLGAQDLGAQDLGAQDLDSRRLNTQRSDSQNHEIERQHLNANLGRGIGDHQPGHDSTNVDGRITKLSGDASEDSSSDADSETTTSTPARSTPNTRSDKDTGYGLPQIQPTLFGPKTSKLRVAGFISAFAVIILGAYLSLRWYATSSAFIGLDKSNVDTANQVLVIYKGREGGVLWWRPVKSEATEVKLIQLRPEDRGQFNSPVEVADVEEARKLISQLLTSAAQQAQQNQQANAGPTEQTQQTNAAQNQVN